MVGFEGKTLSLSCFNLRGGERWVITGCPSSHPTEVGISKEHLPGSWGEEEQGHSPPVGLRGLRGRSGRFSLCPEAKLSPVPAHPPLRCWLPHHLCSTGVLPSFSYIQESVSPLASASFSEGGEEISDTGDDWLRCYGFELLLTIKQSC